MYRPNLSERLSPPDQNAEGLFERGIRMVGAGAAKLVRRLRPPARANV
jgi:hypothetical protein